MHLLLSPALGLILGPTDFGSLDVAVLYQGSSTDFYSLVKSNLLVFDEAALPEVLLALFLLLRLIVGGISCMTSLVVGVIALDYVVVFSLLNHLNFVDTFLSVSSRSCRSNSWETYINIVPLSCQTTVKVLIGFMSGMMIMSFFVMSMMMVLRSILSVKREGVDQRFCISCISSVSSKLSCPKG